MSGTTLISLRLADDILATVDQIAADENRSRAQVISISLRDHLLEGKRGVKAAPLLPPGKGNPGRAVIEAFHQKGRKAEREHFEEQAESKPITNLLGIGGVAPGSDPRYARPAHAPGCKCFSCCPPKGEK